MCVASGCGHLSGVLVFGCEAGGLSRRPSARGWCRACRAQRLHSPCLVPEPARRRPPPTLGPAVVRCWLVGVVFSVALGWLVGVWAPALSGLRALSLTRHVWVWLVPCTGWEAAVAPCR